MHEQVLELIAVRKWHFRLESGHHGGLWLDLELLCRRPSAVRPLARPGSGTPRDVVVERFASRPNDIWAPEECQLCAAHVSLEQVGAR